MHPHLHNKNARSCQDVIQALEECHARGFMWKAVGMCNNKEVLVRKCLRAERIERTRKNREAAKEKRAKTVGLWKEIDENS